MPEKNIAIDFLRVKSSMIQIGTIPSSSTSQRSASLSHPSPQESNCYHVHGCNRLILPLGQTRLRQAKGYEETSGRIASYVAEPEVKSSKARTGRGHQVQYVSLILQLTSLLRSFQRQPVESHLQSPHAALTHHFVQFREEFQ